MSVQAQEEERGGFPAAAGSAALPAAAQAAHLTSVLQAAGVLHDTYVAQVDLIEAVDHMVSRAWRLGLRYGHPAPTAPASLFMKIPTGQRPVLADSGVPKEVAFYAHVAARCIPSAVPRCFEAHWEPQARTSHLLLQDLAGAHALATTWSIAPSLADCERMVRALAALHAHWWNDPQLAAIARLPDAAAAAAWTARWAGEVDRFCAAAGDWLSAERRTLLRKLVDRAPALFALAGRRPLTLVHGDAHAWNCFLARDPADGDVWFDWDNWRIDAGTADLAYFMALQWYPERRRRFEPHLLDVYRHELAARGIAGPSRTALQEDYQVAVLWQVATPIKQSCNDLPPLAWWSALERILLAVDDLGCRELLD